MKWYISKKRMSTPSCGEQICLSPLSQIKNFIEGGKSDGILFVVGLPLHFLVEVGCSYYIGGVIEEAFEPYGLQIKATCSRINKQSVILEVMSDTQPIYELLLS